MMNTANASVASMPAPRLEVRSLSTSFATDGGRVQSVSDVSFRILPGQTLALVGESGSGKSVTSLSLMGLHAKTSHAQVDGEAHFVLRDGRTVDLLKLNPAALRRLIDDARNAHAQQDSQRAATEATYQFMQAMAGDLPGFDEACRALFAHKQSAFLLQTQAWPDDVQAYLHQLSRPIWAA